MDVVIFSLRYFDLLHHTTIGFYTFEKCICIDLDEIRNLLEIRYVIYGLKFGYANGLFKLKQISLDSGDILSQKYYTRAYLKSNINSTLVNHDVNNVHYSATKSLLLKFYFLFSDRDFVG